MENKLASLTVAITTEDLGWVILRTATDTQGRPLTSLFIRSSSELVTASPIYVHASSLVESHIYALIHDHIVLFKENLNLKFILDGRELDSDELDFLESEFIDRIMGGSSCVN
jgi:hypothetical protein